MASSANKIIALSGGVGGAKLAVGLAEVLSQDELLIVANTADDFTHLGLRICPDLDTVMYNLAGIQNKAQGWGIEGETWQFMQQLGKLNGEDWFLLGDKDLATHTVRTQLLQQGETLTAISRGLFKQLGVAAKVVPMCNEPVSTQMQTDEGILSFQHYFVRRQCQPMVSAYQFSGIERATIQPDFAAALADETLAAVIICPSNPFVSVEPILSVPGVRDALRKTTAPIIAVSPIIGGQALKGPAAKMMAELGMPQSATAVAQYYGDLIDGFVIDNVDAGLQSEIEALGTACITAQSIMKTQRDKTDLANICVDFAATIKGNIT
jgi:LPPG:FO 2-phospho-L-lactate transferase